MHEHHRQRNWSRRTRLALLWLVLLALLGVAAAMAVAAALRIGAAG